MSLSLSPFDRYYAKADGSAFSTALRKVVPVTDAQYAAWQATGGVPWSWPTDAAGAQSDAALAALLQGFGITMPGYQQASSDFVGFLALFTAAEQGAIVNSINTRIKLFCLKAAGANAVDLTDPRTISGTDLLGRRWADRQRARCAGTRWSAGTDELTGLQS